MKALYRALFVHMCMSFKSLPDDSYYQYHVAQSAERLVRNKHLQAHKKTHIVFCVALAGSNAGISIWKTAAGRCSCHCCCCLLLVVLSIWMAALLFSLTLALLTFSAALPPVSLRVSSCLSVKLLLFFLAQDSCMTNHIPLGTWGTCSARTYEEWTLITDSFDKKK